MGHGNTSCDPHLHLSHQATKRSTTSREASAAGRLRPNLIFDFRNTIVLSWPLDTQSSPAERPIRGASVSHYTRREFLKTGLAAGALAVTGSLPLRAARQTATDWVTLGKSGVKVTRLAFGTGSFSGRVQRDLGQDGVTRLVRYAYDSGIRFFETAESYAEMQDRKSTRLNSSHSQISYAVF